MKQIDAIYKHEMCIKKDILFHKERIIYLSLEKESTDVLKTQTRHYSAIFLEYLLEKELSL